MKTIEDKAREYANVTPDIQDVEKLKDFSGARNTYNKHHDFVAGAEWMKEQAIEAVISSCEHKDDWCCGAREYHGQILSVPDMCKGRECSYVKTFIEKLK